MEQNRCEAPDGCSSDNEEDHNPNDLKDDVLEGLTMPLLTEEKMRRKLQFFFMNPIEKWQAKKRFPYKFMIQVIKIILVTLQLCLFANNRYTHINYTWDNRVTFSHLFLNGWDSSREINSYPPSAGPLAIYKREEFFQTIEYALDAYVNLNDTIGPYSYPNENNTVTPLVLCLYKYKKGIIFGFNESYVFDSTIEEECFNITKELRAAQYFEDEEFSFSAIIRAVLSFSIKTVNFKGAGPMTPPDCYRFDIAINFDNRDHDGQMLLSLDAEPVRLICKGDIHYVLENKIDRVLTSLLNVLVIIICTVSFVLCSRALWRAQQLKVITNNFFKVNYRRELNDCDKTEFLNMWYIMIIVNDVLIIIGSGIKEQIEHSHFTANQWNIGSVFLGTGNMLVWFGVLRYLGFFKTYNVVILTLKKAAPKVARFSLCALIIYAGYTFCGWLVLGPYHMKFRSLTTTSECLFALVNGDDMFATFSIMDDKSPMLWWFSRIYLYTFISVYIYVVLSLFIAVIMDAYDTIKVYYNRGFPKSDLQAFIGDTLWEEVSSGLYRSDSSGSLDGLLQDLCCCCKKLHKSYSSLSNSRASLRNNVSSTGIPV
ncbi:hypothetical protein RI129_008155 [Pyrocoelia pectoralis]|uniref:Uncharacterized protein n=1 Tax=Pyrocoelia pectoralis TaxID=417401 RepID=A0AAN7VAP1_9COLE